MIYTQIDLTKKRINIPNKIAGKEGESFVRGLEFIIPSEYKDWLISFDVQNAAGEKYKKYPSKTEGNISVYEFSKKDLEARGVLLIEVVLENGDKTYKPFLGEFSIKYAICAEDDSGDIFEDEDEESAELRKEIALNSKSRHDHANKEVIDSLGVNNENTRLTFRDFENSTMVLATIEDVVSQSIALRHDLEEQISKIPKLSVEVVEELPTDAIDDSTIYLVKDSDDENNLYTEYIYINNVWECLGSQSIDLTGYYTKQEINKMGFITEEQLPKTEETDPTVPDWAKQPNKPEYTAEEVGALPINTFIPSNDDIKSEVESALAKAKASGDFKGEQGLSGVYVGSGEMPDGYNVQIDPTGEAVEIPTKTSQLVNDSGFITADDLPEAETNEAVDELKATLAITDILHYNTLANLTINETIARKTYKTYYIDAPIEKGCKYDILFNFDNVTWYSSAYYLTVATISAKTADVTYEVEKIRNYNEEIVGNTLNISFDATSSAKGIKLVFYFGEGSQSINVTLQETKSNTIDIEQSIAPPVTDFFSNQINVQDMLRFSKLKCVHHDNFYRDDNVSEIGCNGTPNLPMAYETVYTNYFPVGINNNTAYSSNPDSIDASNYSLKLVEAQTFPYRIDAVIPEGDLGSIVIGYENVRTFDLITVDKRENRYKITINPKTTATPLNYNAPFGKFTILSVNVYKSYFEIYADDVFVTKCYSKNESGKCGIYFKANNLYKYKMFNVYLPDSFKEYGFNNAFNAYGLVYSGSVNYDFGTMAGYGFKTVSMHNDGTQTTIGVKENEDIIKNGCKSIEFTLKYEPDNPIIANTNARTEIALHALENHNLSSKIFDFDVFFPNTYVADISDMPLKVSEVFFQNHMVWDDTVNKTLYPPVSLRVDRDNQVILCITGANNNPTIRPNILETHNLFTLEPGENGVWHHFTLYIREGYDAHHKPLVICAVDGYVKAVSHCINTYNIINGCAPRFGIYKSIWEYEKTNVDERKLYFNNFRMWY